MSAFWISHGGQLLAVALGLSLGLVSILIGASR